MSIDINNPGIIAILGVAVGFFLSEFSTFFKFISKIIKIRKIIVQELKSIKSQIPQKVSILEQMEAGLKLEKSLPGKSVHIITTGYYNNINTLYLSLNIKSRNCLHVIYERLRVSEEVMDNFEDKIRSEFQKTGDKRSFGYYKIRIGELKKSYKTVDDLIDSYLLGKPTDVFYVDKK